MGLVTCPNCGKLQEGESGFTTCPHCGTPVNLDQQTGGFEQFVGWLFGPHGRSGSARAAAREDTEHDHDRAQLLAQYRADPGNAAMAAYHRAGYVWSYDVRNDRERYFRWRARPNDSYERGLPTDDRDRRGMLAHEVDGADVARLPSSGWQHFRFCDCARCNPAQAESESQLEAWERSPGSLAREELLSGFRADPDHAVAAYHGAGYLWVYDGRKGKERWFRYDDERRDRLGQPVDADDLPKLVQTAREVDAANVPDRGWRYVQESDRHSGSETAMGVIQVVGDFLRFIDPGF